MSVKNRTTHLMVMLPVELVQEIESYQNSNRIRGTNETVRTLIKKGLTVEDE